MSRSYSRHEDETKVVCRRCGWKGMIKDMVHGYEDDGFGDVVAVDECPQCGTDDCYEIYR